MPKYVTSIFRLSMSTMEKMVDIMRKCELKSFKEVVITVIKEANGRKLVWEDNRPFQSTYIMYNHNNGLYKIGKSAKVEVRKSQIANELNTEISLIATLDMDIEIYIHTVYAKFRVSGEWFSLSQNDVLDIINKYGFKEFTKWELSPKNQE